MYITTILIGYTWPWSGDGILFTAQTKTAQTADISARAGGPGCRIKFNDNENPDANTSYLIGQHGQMLLHSHFSMTIHNPQSYIPYTFDDCLAIADGPHTHEHATQHSLVPDSRNKLRHPEDCCIHQ